MVSGAKSKVANAGIDGGGTSFGSWESKRQGLSLGPVSLTGPQLAQNWSVSSFFPLNNLKGYGPVGPVKVSINLLRDN